MPLCCKNSVVGEPLWLTTARRSAESVTRPKITEKYLNYNKKRSLSCSVSRFESRKTEKDKSDLLMSNEKWNDDSKTKILSRRSTSHSCQSVNITKSSSLKRCSTPSLRHRRSESIPKEKTISLNEALEKLRHLSSSKLKPCYYPTRQASRLRNTQHDFKRLIKKKVNDNIDTKTSLIAFGCVNTRKSEFHNFSDNYAKRKKSPSILKAAISTRKQVAAEKQKYISENLAYILEKSETSPTDKSVTKDNEKNNKKTSRNKLNVIKQKQLNNSEKARKIKKTQTKENILKTNSVTNRKIQDNCQTTCEEKKQKSATSQRQSSAKKIETSKKKSQEQTFKTLSKLKGNTKGWRMKQLICASMSQTKKPDLLKQYFSNELIEEISKTKLVKKLNLSELPCAQLQMLNTLHTGLTPRESTPTVIRRRESLNSISENEEFSYITDDLLSVPERSLSTHWLIEKHKKKYQLLEKEKQKQIKIQEKKKISTKPTSLASSSLTKSSHCLLSDVLKLREIKLQNIKKAEHRQAIVNEYEQQNKQKNSGSNKIVSELFDAFLEEEHNLCVLENDVEEQSYEDIASHTATEVY